MQPKDNCVLLCSMLNSSIHTNLSSFSPLPQPFVYCLLPMQIADEKCNAFYISKTLNRLERMWMSFFCIFFFPASFFCCIVLLFILYHLFICPQSTKCSIQKNYARFWYFWLEQIYQQTIEHFLKIYERWECLRKEIKKKVTGYLTICHLLMWGCWETFHRIIFNLFPPNKGTFCFVCR